MKKIISLILALAMTPCLAAFSEPQKSVSIYANKLTFDDGYEVSLSSLPFYAYTDKPHAYLPFDELMPHFCNGIGWDAQKGAIVCSTSESEYCIFPDKFEFEKNGKLINLTAAPTFRNQIFYISDEIFSEIAGYNIYHEDTQNLKLTFFGGEKRFFVNGTEYPLSSEAYIYRSNLFVPLDDVLPACGFAMGWDNNLRAVVLVKNGITSFLFPSEKNIWIDANEYLFDLSPLTISNTTYISAAMLTSISGCEIDTVGTINEYGGRDLLTSTTRSDAHRLSGKSILKGGGVTVVDGFAMECVAFSDQSARSYASIINKAADKLSGYNVYNIVVPTSAEFYAPLSLYPNQLKGIKTVYENLSDKVMPINVYDILSEHSGEKIYFATDHHWTQRGAYYAYKKFAESKGFTIDELDTFTNVPSYNHVGSFANFAKGTAAGNVIKNSPELLERFLPKFATVGTVFNDQNLKSVAYTVKAVNTTNNSYSCFIGGDGPVTIFYTDAPSDETAVIIKESFGNAFAVWAMHNYKKVCVIDPRKFNGFAGYTGTFKLKPFCDLVGANDVIFINYPVSVGSEGIRNALNNML